MHHPLRRALPVVLLAASVLAACSTAPPRFGGSARVHSESEVYETLIRWMHFNYDPSQANGTPTVWCLATGRRAFTAIDRYRRDADEEWHPSRRVLDLVSDLQPPVVPIGECWRSDETQEEFGRGGPPAALLLIEQPVWSTATFATVRMRTRENNAYQYSYVCRVEQRNVVWRVLDCI